MKYNNNWVYRNLYECHYIMSINTNKIISISPLFAEFFQKLNENTTDIDSLICNWVDSLKKRGIEFDNTYLKIFIDNEVFIV